MTPFDYPCHRVSRPLSRREMLLRSANGFGAAALAALLASERPGLSRPSEDNSPFAPKKPPFAA